MVDSTHSLLAGVGDALCEEQGKQGDPHTGVRLHKVGKALFQEQGNEGGACAWCKAADVGNAPVSSTETASGSAKV